MAKPPRLRIRILLLAAMTTGLAMLPRHLTAQAGSGEPGRPFSAWVGEARKGPFHLSTGPVLQNRTVQPAFDIGAANARDVRSRPAPAPGSTVSPGRVFAYTLAGATIPLIPAMYSVGTGSHSLQSAGWFVLGALATLVTVPVAAKGAGGIESLPRALAGTGLGFGVALWFALQATTLPDSEFWIVPVFSVTMASVTTLIATM